MDRPAGGRIAADIHLHLFINIYVFSGNIKYPIRVVFAGGIKHESVEEGEEGGGRRATPQLKHIKPPVRYHCRCSAVYAVYEPR